MTGKQNSVTEKNKDFIEKLRKGQTEFSIPNLFLKKKLEFLLKFKLGKLIKIFRSTVIIGTKNQKQRNYLCCMVFLALSVRLGVSLYQAS
jgi:hypothetical protein